MTACRRGVFSAAADSVIQECTEGRPVLRAHAHENPDPRGRVLSASRCSTIARRDGKAGSSWYERICTSPGAHQRPITSRCLRGHNHSRPECPTAAVERFGHQSESRARPYYSCSTSNPPALDVFYNDEEWTPPLLTRRTPSSTSRPHAFRLFRPQPQLLRDEPRSPAIRAPTTRGRAAHYKNFGETTSRLKVLARPNKACASAQAGLMKPGPR